MATKEKRIIKVTEKQLRETEGEAFKYLDISNTYTPYNGQSEISVSGNMSGEEEGKPIIGDKIGNSITPQSYNRFRSYGNYYPSNVREGVDTNNDNVDDFYNNDELDILSNGDKNDNLTKIPDSVERKVDLLLNSISNLTPKQKAIVLNKIIESYDLTSLPYAWIKELIKKISSGQNEFEKQNVIK